MKPSKDEYINLMDLMQDAEPDLTWEMLVHLNKAEKVTIVRCEDCKRGTYRELNGYEPEVYCKKWDAIMNTDDFCSCGGRKENEKEERN